MSLVVESHDEGGSDSEDDGPSNEGLYSKSFITACTDHPLSGPQFILPPLRNLLEEPRVKDAVDTLIETIIDAAPEKGQGGGRFSLGETEMMTAVCSLVSSTSNTLARLLGDRWDHSEGTILRRLLPTLFTTREENEWNLFLRRYRAKLVAQGKRGLYRFSCIVASIKH